MPVNAPVQPDANGNMPYGTFLGATPGFAGYMQGPNGPINIHGGGAEYATGPQGQGWYTKVTSPAPNRIGVPMPANSGPGINQGGSYFPKSVQTDYEHRAGVAAPQYMSTLDENGNLKSPFSIDPSQSSAFQAMKQTATSTDLSPWALMQEQALNTQTQQQRDQSNAQGQGAVGTAIDKMMMSGNGADSGARSLALAMGERSNIMANQNIGAQSSANDLSIRQQDAQNKAQMLGQVMNTETAAQGANANTGIQDLTNANIFGSNRYNQQMQAWGAEKTAQAQASAAGRGGKK